jgi:hypothetical protein
MRDEIQMAPPHLVAVLLVRLHNSSMDCPLDIAVIYKAPPVCAEFEEKEENARVEIASE